MKEGAEDPLLTVLIRTDGWWKYKDSVDVDSVYEQATPETI